VGLAGIFQTARKGVRQRKKRNADLPAMHDGRLAVGRGRKEPGKNILWHVAGDRGC